MQALRYILNLAAWRTPTYLSDTYVKALSDPVCLACRLFSIFTWNLEETGKSKAESTDLKELLSTSNIILINSSSAILFC